jgi:hypothetical protein
MATATRSPSPRSRRPGRPRAVALGEIAEVIVHMEPRESLRERRSER